MGWISPAFAPMGLRLARALRATDGNIAAGQRARFARCGRVAPSSTHAPQVARGFAAVSDVSGLQLRGKSISGAHVDEGGVATPHDLGSRRRAAGSVDVSAELGDQTRGECQGVGCGRRRCSANALRTWISSSEITSGGRSGSTRGCARMRRSVRSRCGRRMFSGVAAPSSGRSANRQWPLTSARSPFAAAGSEAVGAAPLSAATRTSRALSRASPSGAPPNSFAAQTPASSPSQGASGGAGDGSAPTPSRCRQSAASGQTYTRLRPATAALPRSCRPRPAVSPSSRQLAARRLVPECVPSTNVSTRHGA